MTSQSVIRWLMTGLLCAGCGGRSGLLQPVEVGASADDAVRPDQPYVRDAAPDGGCRALLEVGTVTSQPASCWIDEKVGNQTAALVWDCGSGDARADFAVPFTGTVKSGVVALSATTVFPWSDGCTWRSRQRIDGSLSDGWLTYSYSEEPVTGAGCAPAYCKATAPVLLR